MLSASSHLHPPGAQVSILLWSYRNVDPLALLLPDAPSGVALPTLALEAAFRIQQAVLFLDPH